MGEENRTASIGPKTVTILGDHWPESSPWAGFDWSRAELRSDSIWNNGDYHLGVPWMHPDEIAQYGRDQDFEAIYRVRLKRGWRSFVRVDGAWCVSKAPPTEQAPFGTSPDEQVTVIDVATVA